MTLIDFYISSYREITGATSYTKMFKSSSTSCFKYFVIIKFSKFFKKDKFFRRNWTACRILYFYLRQVNQSKGNLSSNFLFLKFFSNTKLNSKAITDIVLKKAVPKTSGIFTGKCLCWSLFLITSHTFRTFERGALYTDT